MIYLAFHNNADLQAEVLAEVRQHVAADRVIQGTYGDEHGACFIGCLANGENDKGTVTERAGWPPVLIGIAENIFEGLPPSRIARRFSTTRSTPPGSARTCH